MARRRLPAHPTGAQNASLRLARLAPLTPQALPLGKRAGAVPSHQLLMPAAHPVLLTPMVRR